MIEKGNKSDIEEVYKSYLELFKYEKVYTNHSNWVKGVYPSRETAQHAYDQQSLYVLKENGHICGSMILNEIQPNEYDEINWKYDAKDSQVLVLHTLCISPTCKGKGYGKQFIEYALGYARKNNYKVIRLDTWLGNKPACSLYEKMGFKVAGKGRMVLQGVIEEEQIYFEKEVIYE